LARRAKASLDLVLVHECYALKDPASSWGPYDPAADSALKEKEGAYLDSVRKRLASPERVRCAIVDGTIADALIEWIQSQKTDLIVMTSHGRGPLSRAFLGSVADELMRRATAPVLLLRPQEKPQGAGQELPLRRLLIPLDGSALARHALEPVAELATLARAKVLLLHVLPSDETAPEQAAPIGAGRPEATSLASAAEAARTYLEDVASQLRRESLEVDSHVLVGRHPASAILEEAAAQHCDPIGLATHGRGGLRRLLLGSVADKVVRAASTPLLICRPQGD
jgi:nucleotide-binding universal stress UspA family protein